ncbi:hypothetical protein [Actinomadura alba]|uniref:Uncharacterized protein n=1 Tax=Actinomadura alba TaxID=406431 RepID=A0ABR7M311_9ACTN|nr:hypothetical protein [Actinomadura alba]MBC6471209.1 hypothetical protein [Actinomadura alba]
MNLAWVVLGVCQDLERLDETGCLMRRDQMSDAQQDELAISSSTGRVAAVSVAISLAATLAGAAIVVLVFILAGSFTSGLLIGVIFIVVGLCWTAALVSKSIRLAALPPKITRDGLALRQQFSKNYDLLIAWPQVKRIWIDSIQGQPYLLVEPYDTVDVVGGDTNKAKFGAPVAIGIKGTSATPEQIAQAVARFSDGTLELA